jgi:quinol monooxygenase YgiN
MAARRLWRGAGQNHQDRLFVAALTFSENELEALTVRKALFRLVYAEKTRPRVRRGLMYGGLVRFTVKAEKLDEFLELMRWDAQVARDDEPGTLRFDVWEVEEEPGAVYVYEVYKDVAAFEDHTKSAPVKKFMEVMSGLIEDVAMVIPFGESVTSNADE